MASYNQTWFSIQGFRVTSPLQLCVFSLLLLVYVFSILVNMLIIIIITLHQHLQTPMYFFLRNLAILDMSLSSCTLPKLLVIFGSGDESISFSGCMLQLYFYISVGSIVFYTLGLLSLDRYIAICHPLRYNTLLPIQLCRKLVIFAWVFGFLEFIPMIFLTSQLDWCSSNVVIDHFFCDGSTLLHISCSSTDVVENIYFWFASITILGTFLPTLSSYCFIISTILRISLSTCRKKMFSTCSSHFIVVSIAYGCCIFIYVRPAGHFTTRHEKTVAIFNSILAPLLHPLIYTLRNQAVLHGLKHMLKKIKSINN
ncbi:olfactory receptor 2AP1-like [Bufo bufo]|uniref:olfactory receptor 2AP1-like n=1 Tax=Bufo bufo TaxID=8384 RepID=UPI001ABE9C06|nr:olfactory receptor 2AP1-like [Bufo bufo]